MSASVNKVILIGRVVSEVDPVRTLSNGSTVTKFRLAVGRGKKNAQGVWENQDTMYIDCEVFAYADAKRNLVDIVTKYVKKGDNLYLEGRLKLDEWDDKGTGQKRQKHKIDVTDVQFLGGNKQDDGDDGDQQAPPPRQQRQATRPVSHGGGDDFGVDIPF
jgi:single-strand DNA-binding protein